MKGFNIAESGHVVQVLPPVSISGGKTGQRFSMANYDHASILIMIGVMAATAPSAILVKGCTAVTGGTATAIPFRYYKSRGGGTSIDQTSPAVVATASGITAFDVASSEFIVIEIDSAELDTLGDASNTTDYPYVEVSVTDTGNTTIMSIVAILSSARYAGQGTSSPTATS